MALATGVSTSTSPQGDFPWLGVNAVSFLQCFDTVGWVMERAYGFLEICVKVLFWN